MNKKDSASETLISYVCVRKTAQDSQEDSSTAGQAIQNVLETGIMDVLKQLSRVKQPVKTVTAGMSDENTL